MPHPKHEQVRARYKGHCGYCGVSEIDAGGELTVDHHRPTTAGGADDDDNLVYAFSRCNLYKSDFYPGPVDIARGCRVLHPLLDDVPSHIRLNQASGDLEPLTVTGRFHIALLRLNRPLLVQTVFGNALPSCLPSGFACSRRKTAICEQLVRSKRSISITCAVCCNLKRLPNRPETSLGSDTASPRSASRCATPRPPCSTACSRCCPQRTATGSLVISAAKSELAKAGISGATIGRAVQQFNLEVSYTVNDKGERTYFWRRAQPSRLR